MSAYWLGVATPLIACIGVAVGLLLIRSTLALASFTLRRVGKSNPNQRRGMAAVVFAAKRYWYLAAGDFAVVLIVGLDDDERKAAADRLKPPARSFAAVAKPSRKAAEG